jgi:hypothetical protein
MKNPALSIWCVATGCEAKLLVIGISVAIGKEQGLELWSDGLRLVEGSYCLRLGESIGVLGLKAKMSLIFTLLPLIIQDPSMVCIFPLSGGLRAR